MKVLSSLLGRNRALTLSMVGLALIACGGSTTTASPGSKSTYTITVDADLSGINAPSAVPATQGFQAYIADLNSSGGVNGHHINLPVLDDRSDLPTALANYQQTLSSDSLGFLGNTNSGIVSAIGLKATQDGIAEASFPGYNTGVGTFPYVYNLNPVGPTYFNIIASFAVSQTPNPQGAKAAFIAYDSALTQTFDAPLAKALSAKGFSMAYSQHVPVSAIDLSVAAGSIASRAPAIVVTSLQDAQIVQFVQALRARSYSGPVINFSSGVTPASLKKLDDPKMYVVQYTADPTNLNNPDVAAMNKIAVKTGFASGASNQFFIENYVFAKVVAAAITKCGDKCTRDSFNSALESSKVSAGTLMAGTPGFSPTNHVMTQKVVISQWDNSAGYTAPIKGFGF